MGPKKRTRYLHNRLVVGDVNDKGEDRSKNVGEDTLVTNTDLTLKDEKAQTDTSNDIPIH